MDDDERDTIGTVTFFGRDLGVRRFVGGGGASSRQRNIIVAFE